MGVFQSNVFQNNVFQGPHGPVVVAPTTFVAGGTIVAHRPPHGIKYTRDDHVRLKRKRRREELAQERLLASLSELELAQIQLAETEAELASLTGSYFVNPTRDAFDKIASLTEQRDQLALKVATLTEHEAKAQAALDLAERQTTKAQADAILTEARRLQLAGRITDLNLGSANSLAAQQIAHATQMAHLMRVAIAPQIAAHNAARAAEQKSRNDAVAVAMRRAQQDENDANELMMLGMHGVDENDANELIQLGMQWTNQN